MKQYSIGIDVGGTNIKVGLFDAQTQLIDSFDTLTDKEADVDLLLNVLEAIIKRLLDKNGLTMRDLKGVGAAFPSYIDHAAGMIVETMNIVSLENIPIVQLMTERFGVPVRIDNDANTAAIAEHRLGAGIDHDNMIYATLSTGIGGGLILNGKLYRGMHGMAGEIGHMFVTDTFGAPCSCGVSGCVQSVASGINMAKSVIERIKEGEESSILNYAGTLSGIDGVAIGKALRANDALALSVVNRSAEYLGRMFHSLNQVLDINVFIYGGGVTKLGSRYIDRIIAAYRHYSLNEQRYPASFIPAKLGENASMIGAALLINDEL